MINKRNIARTKLIILAILFWGIISFLLAYDNSAREYGLAILTLIIFFAPPVMIVLFFLIARLINKLLIEAGF